MDDDFGTSLDMMLSLSFDDDVVVVVALVTAVQYCCSSGW